MANPAETPNILEMSDEDFMKDVPLFDAASFVPDNTSGEGEDEGEDSSGTDAGDDGEGKAKAEELSAGDGEEENEDTADNGKDPLLPGTDAGKEGQDDGGSDKETSVATEAEKTASSNGLTDEQYAVIGRQIMAEFKANGTMMKVKSAEDALQLMQMGANYHKKMVGLKPSLKTLKLLENNGLLDHEKLNYLIDLYQKKPEAIKQLLKDSSIDPLSIDLEDKNEYVPQKRTVNDKELLLDEVLNNISESPTYDRTLDVIGNKWDELSRKAVADNPELISIINTHMENGIFDQVAQAVAYERSLGKLSGMSELDAYQRVGAYMHENNLFKGATAQPAAVNQAQQDPVTRESLTAQQQEEKARQERKRAASPSRQGGASGKNESYNPLTMSDEEFAKINNLSI